jgi:hypothetical protein
MLSAPVHAVVMTVWWRCHGDGVKTRDWPIVAAGRAWRRPGAAIMATAGTTGVAGGRPAERRVNGGGGDGPDSWRMSASRGICPVLPGAGWVSRPIGNNRTLIGGPGTPRGEIPLAVLGGRVVDLEEELQDVPVGDPLGVEDDLDRLGVAGMVPVGRVGVLATGVSDAGGDDAVPLGKQLLDSPEAPSGS